MNKLSRTLNIVSLHVFSLKQNKIRMELLLRKCYRLLIVQQEHNTMLSVRVIHTLYFFVTQKLFTRHNVM